MPSPRPPLVAIITGNAATTIGNAIASAADAGAPADFVVWDHGSDDGTADLVRTEIARRPGWTLDTGAGLAPAEVLNRLAASAGGRDLVVITGDAVVRTPGWLAVLLQTAERHPGAGVIGARILQPDGRVRSAGRRIVQAFGRRDSHSCIGAHDLAVPAAGQARLVDSVAPALTFFRASALEACGGFDGRFADPALLQDDFCLAVRAGQGDVLCDPGIDVVRAVRMEADPEPPPAQLAAWKDKWGWNPLYPNLHAIRRRWGHTRICWQIGERLLAPELPEKPDVDVVIVTWNSLSKLRDCLESLAATDYPAARITLHLLDNGSTDGTPEFIRSLMLPRACRFAVRAELLPVNLGLPPALNLLIARGTAPLVARLDDDIRLPKHWLRLFVEDLRRLPYAGVVGGKIVNLGQPGLQHVGEPWCQKIETDDRGQYDYLALTNHVRGCCNLYRRKAFEVAGLLDVRFNPSQFDDPDHHLALRAAGFDIVYDGRVAVEHHLGTGADASRRSAANARANYQKLVGKWGDDAFRILDHGLQLSGRLLEDHRPHALRPAPRSAA